MKTWKYHNNRTVHFNETPTKGTNSALNSEEEGESESKEEDSEPDKDTAQVKDLLRRAETTVTLAIQKLSSRPGTPSSMNSPLPKTSPLPGKSQLSTTEIYQVPTPPVSKGKQPAPIPPPRTKTTSSSSQPPQTSSVPPIAKPPAQSPLSGNTKGTAPLSAPYSSASTSKAPPPGGGPPNPPPTTIPMTTNQPCILGTAPEPFDGKGDNAIAFWNVLDNYFTVNATTFDMDKKKIASALTYFKQGTQAGDWASDHITITLATNPTDYGTWQAFKDTFKAQFIPLETQVEAIKRVHTTPQQNREFNEWYQEWSKYARRANIDDATKMYAFRSALNTALHNKILQLSPMLTTLKD